MPILFYEVVLKNQMKKWAEIHLRVKRICYDINKIVISKMI